MAEMVWGPRPLRKIGDFVQRLTHSRPGMPRHGVGVPYAFLEPAPEEATLNGLPGEEQGVIPDEVD